MISDPARPVPRQNLFGDRAGSHRLWAHSGRSAHVSNICLLAFCALIGTAAQLRADQPIDLEEMSGRAFEGAQWVMATQAARAVAQMGARAMVGDGPLAKLIRERQQAEVTLNEARSSYASTARDGLNDPARARDTALGLGRKLHSLDAEIRSRFPEYADIATPKPLGYAALRTYLSAKEGLVLFLSAPGATYVWAVSQSGVAWHRAPVTAAELSDRVRSLRADLDPTGPSRSATPLLAPTPPSGPKFDMGAAFALYADLLKPVMHVLNDVDHLFVVKDGALSSLPLAVLLTAPPTDGMALNDAPWLIRAVALTTLPGVSSLGSIRASGSQPVARRDTTFVGFGDPDFQHGADIADAAQNAVTASRSIDAFFDGQGTRIDAIRTLSPLPGTSRELTQIAALFPMGHATVKTGAEATEAAVKSLHLKQTSILSFATHGLVTGDISGLAEPALALTPPRRATPFDDGLLTASEASQLELDADWVILSACNTAAGDGTPGAEGLSGLARAFLFAGARSILVSHWPVRDDVAARLTADTLQRLNNDPNLGKSQALRRAMLALMADTSDRSLTHPAAWAPFVVVGEGGTLHR